MVVLVNLAGTEQVVNGPSLRMAEVVRAIELHQDQTAIVLDLRAIWDKLV